MFRSGRSRSKQELTKLVRGLVEFALILLVALIGAEVSLRFILTEMEVTGYSFTSGMSIPDNRYRRIMAPDFRGVAFHPDKVQFVPVELDRDGFLPATETSFGREKTSVVLLGGKSMVFSSGLPANHTLNSAMTCNSSCPMKVYNTAWPGFGLYRNFCIYRELLEKKIRPALVILNLYGAFDGGIPTEFERPPEKLTKENLPSEPEKNKNQAPWSYLWVQSVKGGAIVWEFGRSVWVKLLAGIGLINRPEPFEPTARRLPAPGISPLDTRARTKAFIEFVGRYFREQGVKMLIVFLPRRYSPPDFYEDDLADLPEDLPVLDLHRELILELNLEDFIWEGHYGRRTMNLIGARLSREACRILNTLDLESRAGI